MEEWCRRHKVGRQTAYDEINAGRLIANKVGRRTIITRANSKRWRESLPTIEPKSGDDT
ncbi:MAG: DNA-binding protein [Alphaproteobacteria bacterium]|nr:DNA-binding protein [Alphaproteobacteria bacterium]